MADTAITADMRNVVDDEDLQWHGKPQWKAFLYKRLFVAILIGLFFGSWFAGFVSIVITAVLAFAGFGLIDFTFPVIAIGVVLSQFAYAAVAFWAIKRNYEYTEYAVTDRRLIQFGGVIGRDYSSIEWDRVQDLEVSVGIIGNWCDTGDIKLTVAGGSRNAFGGGVTFIAVENPYNLLDMLEELRSESGKGE